MNDLQPGQHAIYQGTLKVIVLKSTPAGVIVDFGHATALVKREELELLA